MAFQTAAALTALRDLAAACAGVQQAVIGVPEAPSYVTTVAVSILDSEQRTRPMSTHERVQRYEVLWMRAVAGQEEQAELELAAFKDDWNTRWLASRRSGVLAGAVWDDTLAAAPEYRVTAAMEARFYPMTVSVPMTAALPTTP